MQVGKPDQFEEKGTGAREGGERLLSPGQKFNPSPGQRDRKLLPSDTSPAASWAG